jgi:hypothetical protein
MRTIPLLCSLAASLVITAESSAQPAPGTTVSASPEAERSGQKASSAVVRRARDRRWSRQSRSNASSAV